MVFEYKGKKIMLNSVNLNNGRLIFTTGGSYLKDTVEFLKGLQEFTNNSLENSIIGWYNGVPVLKDDNIKYLEQ